MYDFFSDEDEMLMIVGGKSGGGGSNEIRSVRDRDDENNLPKSTSSFLYRLIFLSHCFDKI